MEPEDLLVLEVAGSIEDFGRAVSRIGGLEWLATVTEDDAPADEDFWGPHAGEPLSERVYLVMSEQRGLAQLLNLWERYSADRGTARLPTGLGPIKDLFNHLRTIRPWGPADRLADTGLPEDFERRSGAGQTVALLELELWYQRASAKRRGAEQAVRRQVEELLGRTHRSVEIDPIGYHGLLAELPINAIGEMVAGRVNALISSHHLMRVRPMGQTTVQPSDDEPLETYAAPIDAVARAPTRAALLDGLPLQRHRLLDGRLVVDDPDGWEATYQAEDRKHGTGMASLILHGDLGAGEATLDQPLYVRPILRPETDLFGRTLERVPESELPVDLVHRAVARMFGEPNPVAPDVIVINHAIADEARVFDRSMGAWARLLDYLSWHYRVLIIASAGNFAQPIDVDIPWPDFAALRTDPQRLQQVILHAVLRDPIQRRLISPAESVNAVTVGSVHDDSSVDAPPPNQTDPYINRALPSPVSRNGPGFGRSLKPDILFAGGRQTYSHLPGTGGRGTRLTPGSHLRSPGNRAAAPTRGGDLDQVAYSRGTSNATALATRAALRLLQVVEAEIAADATGRRMSRGHLAVTLKALLVHGAKREGINALTEVAQPNDVKRAYGRLAGYGTADPNRVSASKDDRVTLLGWGDLADGNANRYEIPVPSAFNAVAGGRRLTITLAWLTPINLRHASYRDAALWFDVFGSDLEDGNLERMLQVRRIGADHHWVRRGTIQHEVFDGSRAVAVGANDTGYIQVNCRSDTSGLHQAVPYALVITIESMIGVPIYAEIANRIRIPVEVEVGAP